MGDVRGTASGSTSGQYAIEHAVSAYPCQCATCKAERAAQAELDRKAWLAGTSTSTKRSASGTPARWFGLTLSTGPRGSR